MTVQYIPLIIKPEFWQNLMHDLHRDNSEQILDNLLIIVPTANHIINFEQAWLNYYDYKQVQVPRIVTLGHILAEYNLTYTKYNVWEQYLSLYQFFIQNPNLLENFNQKNFNQKWEYIKALADICNELSEKYLHTVNINQNLELEDSFNQVNIILEQAVEKEYHNLSQKIAQSELHIILQVWKYTINLNHQPFYTWQACINFAHLSSYNLLYIAYDLKDKNLWYIQQNYNYAKYKLIVTNILWDNHSLQDIFPETLNIEKPSFTYNKFQPLISKLETHVLNLEIIQAQNLAEVADYTLYSILYALQQGKKNIALIAQDRVAIRQIKALLQNYNIPLADETGWKISTTLIASCIKQWFNILKTNIFNIYCIEFAVKNLNFILDENIFTELYKYHNKYIYQLPNSSFTDSLKEQINLWQTTQSLLGWQHSWYMWCKWLNFDLLEHQINNICMHINKLCSGDKINIYTLDEFILFVQNILEQENIANLYDIAEQKVHIIALNGSRLREFDQVYFIGSDNNQLPSAQQHGLLLNENMRYSLNLDTKAMRFANQARDLLQLIYMHENSSVKFIYQAYNNQNEQQELSCWLTKLHKYKNIKYTYASENIKVLLPKIADIKVINVNSAINYQENNVPNLAFNNIKTLSISNILSLYTCPYQFYLTKVVNLKKPYIVNGKNPAEYGKLIHKILDEYHQNYKFINVQQCIDDLLIISKNYLNFESLKQDVYLQETYMLWKKQIQYYAEWQNTCHQQGDKWRAGELALSIQLDTKYPITLKARLDRVDINQAQKIIKIIDYKWKDKIKEDTQSLQLFIYQYLYKNIYAKDYLDYTIESYFLLLKAQPITLQKTKNYKNIANELDIMQDLTDKINQYQNGKFFKAQNGKHCKNCNYYYMCNYKEIENEEEHEEAE